jgi:hypothetical protein
MPGKSPARPATAGHRTNIMFKCCVLINAAFFSFMPFAFAQDGPQSNCEQAQHLAGRDQPDTFQALENALKLADCLGHEDPALEADQDDPRWQDPYASLEGLARIHNTENFAAAVFVRASASGEAALAPIAEAAEGVIRSIP